MISVGTRLKVIDNSGGKEVVCLKILGKSNFQVGYPGDTFVGSVKKIIPGKKIRKGEVIRGVITGVKKGVERKNGITTTFNENSCVIISSKNAPIGTRILGPVMVELREKGLLKVISMATATF